MPPILSAINLGLALLGPVAPGTATLATTIAARESAIAQAPSAGAGEMLALAVVAQGLPQRAPEPRTLHAFWPVFAGFVVTWIGIVAYLLSFSGRLSRLADAMSGSAGREGK